MAMKHLYEYTNYRDYLRDYYADRKASDAGFSYRMLSGAMGFSSPNFMKLVIDGQRNLGKESVGRVIRGLGLKKKEKDYFAYLVFFAHAKTDVDRNYYFGLIAAIRARTTVCSIAPDQFEYYHEWYNCVVRELVSGRSENLDFEQLAKTVRPAITPGQVKKAVKLLLDLGFVRVGEDGRYAQACPVISTSAEVNSLAVRNYHDEMIGLAQKALHEVQPADREISSATVHVSEQGFRRLKDRIQKFRDEVLQIVKEDSDVDRVYQMNVQFFPVSGREAGHG